MDIDVALFILASLTLVIDYASAGFYQLWLAGKAGDPDTKRFLTGKGGLLLMGAAKDAFWLGLVLLGLFEVRLDDYPLARHAATVLIVSLTITAVINRRRWWRQIHSAAGFANGDTEYVKVLPDHIHIMEALQSAEVALAAVTDSGESQVEQELSAEALQKLRNVLNLYEDLST